MEIFLVKGDDNRFTVAYDTDYEKIYKLKTGKVLKCKITQPRNLRLHNKFMALVRMVYNNQEHYNNFDHLRKDLIKSAGFYEERVSFDGELTQEAKSISFTGMEEHEFQDLYSKVIDVIVQYFNFDKEDILINVQQYF